MHHRTFLDPGLHGTRWAAHWIPDQLFDRQLDVGSASLVVQDHHVFEADEGLEYLAMVAKNEGASWLLGHTSSLKHLRRARGDPGQGQTPPESDEPEKELFARAAFLLNQQTRIRHERRVAALRKWSCTPIAEH